MPKLVILKRYILHKYVNIGKLVLLNRVPTGFNYKSLASAGIIVELTFNNFNIAWLVDFNEFSFIDVAIASSVVYINIILKSDGVNFDRRWAHEVYKIAPSRLSCSRCDIMI